MTAKRVVATRSEMDHIRALIAEAIGILDGILERPDPKPVATDKAGWPILPDDGTKP